MPDWPRLPPAPRLLVISGPSGSGKSTVIQRACALEPALVRCLSCTTRAPRGAERDGVDYWFLTQAEFDARAAAGGFIEHAVVFGKASYGTPRAFVEERLAAGQSVIKDVDVQGAAQIRASFPAAVHIFLVPPDHAEVERRLRGRGTDSDEVVRRRLAEVEREVARWRDYDYLLVNADVERAAHDLLAVLRAKGMEAELVAMGRKVAETMVELFAGLPAGHEFFDRFSFIA
ncbi:MAG: guanylate kinase, partial [Planctomycetes bacterium]|nr:guanylate kinase [Planctomycetota bacterium]